MIIFPLIIVAIAYVWRYERTRATLMIVLVDVAKWCAGLAACMFVWAAIWDLSGQEPYGFTIDSIYAQTRMLLWFATAASLIWLAEKTIQHYKKDEAPR